MKKLEIIIAATMLSLLLAPQAYSQKATERYIPIGESPGLSGIATYIGRIQGFDAASSTLSLSTDGRVHAVRITDDTRIWLDRSASELSNLEGDTSDLAAGRRAEVAYVDTDAREAASWVKVEVAN